MPRSKKAQMKKKVTQPSSGNAMSKIIKAALKPLQGLIQVPAKAFRSLTGSGDYKVASNSLLGNQPAMFSPTKNGVRITHREFLGDITGSTGFSISSAYPLNAAYSTTFPWLSNVASEFEEYEFLGLVFEFRSSSGSAISSSSSALGTVIMATDYDATNPAFVNKQAMESYQYCVSGVPFNNLLHPVECKRYQNVLGRLYTREVTESTTGNDLRFTDMGNFFIATSGMQSAYTIGELWVSYDVRLYKPRLTSVSGVPTVQYFHAVQGTGTSTAAAPLSTGFTTNFITPGVASLVTFTSGNTFNFSLPGTYSVTLIWNALTIASGPTLTADNGLSFVNAFDENALSTVGTFTTTRAMACCIAIVPSSSAAISIGGLGSMTSGNLDILVSQLPAGAD